MGKQHSKIHPHITDNKTYMKDYMRRQFEGKLFQAIANRNYKLARILVEGGVNVNCSLRTGITPLMIACDQRSMGHNRRIQRHLIRSLLSNNANVNVMDNLGQTPLVYAYLSGDVQIIRLLEVHGSLSLLGNRRLSGRGSPRDSVVFTSNLGVYFHRWESIDYFDALD